MHLYPPQTDANLIVLQENTTGSLIVILVHLGWCYDYFLGSGGLASDVKQAVTNTKAGLVPNRDPAAEGV